MQDLVNTEYALREEISTLKNRIKSFENSKIEHQKDLPDKILNNINQVVFQTDIEGNWVYLNNFWEELTGYSPEESLGKFFLEYVDVDYREYNQQKFKPLIERKKSICRHEVKYINKNGPSKWVEVYAKLVLDGNDKIIGTAGTLTDISERKQNENQLNIYREIIKSASEGILIIENKENPVAVECNESFEKISGYKEVELKSKSIYELLKILGITIPHVDIYNIINQGKSYSSVVNTKRKKGTNYWNEFDIRPILNNSGEINNIVLLIKDITKRKKAVSLLKKKAQEYKTLFENIYDGVIIFEPEEEIILEANSSACRMYGMEKNEFIGTSLKSISKNISNGRKNIDEVMEKGEIELETIHFKKDGSEIILESKAKTINYYGKKCILATQRDITEYKNTFSALQKSEEKFRALTENSDDVIMRFDRNHRHIYVNSAVEEMTGIPKTKFLGKKHSDLNFPTDLTQKWETAVEKVFTNREKDRLEFQLPNKSWIDWLLVPEYNKNGEIETIISSARDITSIKEIEFQLEKKDKLMQAVAKFATLMISVDNYEESIQKGLTIIGKVSDADRIYIFRNEKSEEDEEILASQIFEWVKEGIKPQIKNPDLQKVPLFQRWIKIFSRGEIINQPIENLPKDEKVILEEQGILSILVFPLIVDSTLWGFIGFDDCCRGEIWDEVEVNTLHILTEIISGSIKREIISKQLKDSQEKWKLLFKMAPDAYYLLDEKGFFIDINLEAEKMIGYRKREVVGKNILKISILESDQKLKASTLHSTIIKGIDPGPQELILKKSNGIKIYVEIRSFPMFINGKRLVLGIARDISKRIELETNTRKSFNKLREINELKSQFVSMVSHEFRTPLSLILASADLLEIQDQKWGSKKRMEHINKIQSAVEHMTTMLHEVITLNKAEAGRITFNPTKFNLLNFISNLIEDIKSSPGFNHQINFSYEGRDENIKADKDLLKHIINNLLVNSIKYTNSGGNINVKIILKEELLSFIVSDTGIGIKTKDQEHLFEPFFRGSNVENRNGTGLGLAMVKSAVGIHKGSISFSSEINKGTTFKIDIPLEQQNIS